MWAWGANGQGQLGDGTLDARGTPEAISGVSGVTRIAAGRMHGLARRSDGTVWAWGHNSHGQLGTGTTERSLTPVPSRLP